MYKKTRALLTNFSLLLVAFGFALLLSEVMVRVFFPPLPTVNIFSAENMKLFYVFDPLLGWRKKPNHRGVVTSAFNEFTVLEEFNSRGIRGPEYPYEKKQGEVRILVLGDSFTNGDMVPFEELLTERLKVGLKNGGHKTYEVINAGTNGYSTDQELLYFQHEGRKYSPDLTVVMFYYNDIWWNIQPKYRVGHKPLFRVKESKLLLTNVPLPPPDGKLLLTNVPDPSTSEWTFLRRLKHLLTQKSMLYLLVRDRVKSSFDLYTLAVALHLAERPIADEIRPPGQGQAVKRELPLLGYIPEEFKVFETSYDSEVLQAWDLTEAILRELKTATASVGSRLLVFYIPSKASIYSESWAATKRRYGIKNDDGWDIERPGLVLKSICKRNDIDYIDPTEVFKREAEKLRSEGKKLYFDIDNHWNSLGHKLAGEVLLKHVLTDLNSQVYATGRDSRISRNSSGNLPLR